MLNADDVARRICLRRQLRSWRFLRDQFLELAAQRDDPVERRVDVDYAAEANETIDRIRDELGLTDRRG